MDFVVGLVSVPGHVADFYQQLAQKPEEPETLDWVDEQLSSFADQRSSWRWDDRLGVLAISFGTEMTIYYTLSIVLGLLFASLAPDSSPQLRLGILFGVMLGLVLALGDFFRGGPVFQFAGIQVRRYRNGVAGRLRCAVRNFIAWFPAVSGFCMFGLWLADFIIRSQTPTTESSEVLREHTFFYVALSVVWFVPVILHFLGAVISVLSPSRGVQDWLAGTYIVPK